MIDLQDSAKDIRKDMYKPMAKGVKKLKRVSSHSIEGKRMVWKIDEVNEELQWIHVHVDSDWAGDKSTRMSTSGGILTVGRVLHSTRRNCRGSSSLGQGPLTGSAGTPVNGLISGNLHRVAKAASQDQSHGDGVPLAPAGCSSWASSLLEDPRIEEPGRLLDKTVVKMGA